MSDEIRPSSIYRPHMTRPVSRQRQKKKNDEKFREQLEELAEQRQREREAGQQQPQPQQHEPEADCEERDEGLGENLDVST